MKSFKNLKAIVLSLTLFTFIFAISYSDVLRLRDSQATALGLPAPTELLELSHASKEFNTVLLRGVEFADLNSRELTFYFDVPTGEKLNETDLNRQISYFYAALMMPAKSLWVNLSPYEKDRIIDPALEETALGYELLTQDYMLKQLSSSLTNPKTELGSLYWNQESNSDFLTSNFDKVWLSPGEVDVVDNGSVILIKEALLKAQTEADYLDTSAEKKISQNNRLSVLLPTIEKEVNNGTNFKKLRQIYYASVLAQYFKTHLQNSFYNKHLNSAQTSGVSDPKLYIKDIVYDLYNKSFQKGVYRLNLSQKNKADRSRKSYFSGGLMLALENPVVGSSSMENENDAFQGEQLNVTVNTDEDIRHDVIVEKPRMLDDEQQRKRNKFVKVLSSVDLYELTDPKDNKVDSNGKVKPSFDSLLNVFKTVEHIVNFMGQYGFAHTNFVVTKQNGKIVIKEEHATHTNVFGISDENAVDIESDPHAFGGLAKVYKYVSTIDRRQSQKRADKRASSRRTQESRRKETKTNKKIRIDRRVAFEDKRQSKDKRQEDRRLDNKGQERILRIANTEGISTKEGYKRFLKNFLSDVKTSILHDSFPNNLDGYVKVDAIVIATVDESLREELGCKYFFATDSRFGGQDLVSYRSTNKTISGSDMKKMFLSAMKVLSYMHSRNIPHADIKPHNILRNLLGIGEFIDFGGAHEGGTVLENGPLTLQILAPELADEWINGNGKRRQTKAGDVYALACTMFYMLSGESYNRAPDSNLINYLKERAAQNADYFESRKSKIPLAYRPLLKKMFNVDPTANARIDINKAIEMFESISNLEILANSRDLKISKYKDVIKESLKNKEREIKNRQSVIEKYIKNLGIRKEKLFAKQRELTTAKHDGQTMKDLSDIQMTLININNEIDKYELESSANSELLNDIKFAKSFPMVESYDDLIEFNSELHRDKLIDYSSSSIENTKNNKNGGLDFYLSDLNTTSVEDLQTNLYQLSFKIEKIEYEK